MNLAPITLFVYNRPWHTQQTLEALMQNEYANQSTLYIYCDGAKENAVKEDIDKIVEVRKVIRSKPWCKDVKIIEQPTNLGLANSVINGVAQVVNKHGNIIVLEDDIVTGRCFLKYMNEALELYEKEEKVFGVSGYKYPSNSEVEDSTYFLPIGSSWSYATWLDRWKEVSFDGERLLQKINELDLKKKMNFGGYPYYEMLKDQIEGKNNSWAIRFYTSMFLKEKFFLYPNVSLVKNIGFDNSGTHCSTDDFFSKINVSDQSVHIEKKNVSLNSRIIKLFEKSFKSENASRLGLIDRFERIIEKVIKIIEKK